MHTDRTAFVNVQAAVHMAHGSVIQKLVTSLAERDWAVCDGFLHPPRIATLRAEAEDLHASGRFRSAGIGHDASKRADIRGDELFWLTPDMAPQAWDVLQRELEALRLAMNAATYLGLHEFEGHYAIYPPGAAYERHLDSFRDGNQRVVSVVLYLNRDWRAVDGGELRLYPGGAHALTPVKLLPHGGTLVCFLSERIPHEVSMAHRMRFSLAGWFRRRA